MPKKIVLLHAKYWMFCRWTFFSSRSPTNRVRVVVFAMELSYMTFDMYFMLYLRILELKLHCAMYYEDRTNCGGSANRAKSLQF